MTLRASVLLAVALTIAPRWTLVAATAADARSAQTWPGADLFTNGAVERVSIELSATNLAALKEDARSFVRATVREAATTYSDVAIHLKGSVGSFRPIDDKPALTLDFDRFNDGQRYHGLRRIHLNNSVEDPSYANEQLGSQVFRAAGVPAPRVGHAVVTLNGRRLGLYVLKEGFTEDFLGCYFKQVGGNLYEPDEGHDVNQVLKRNSIHAPHRKSAALEALAQAALEPDPERRWQRLEPLLDLDEFIRFMALEVMLGHRDGYSLARNNFRVYENLDTGKVVFFPHGMDQLLGNPALPWQPQMAGLVARAVMTTPKGHQLYRESFMNLFTNLFNTAGLSRTVTQLPERLGPWLSPSELAELKAAGEQVSARLSQRRRYLASQLTQPEPGLLQLTNGVGCLSGWVNGEEPGSGSMDAGRSADGTPSLHISVHADSAASWRTKTLLGPGRYRFEGRARVAGVKPLAYGRRQGAGLRIAGSDAAWTGLLGDAPWRTVATEFAVPGGPATVECICELRAQSGEVWFDTQSLKIIKLE